MKITSLQISNVLSFPYRENIGDAEKLTFDDGLNIIIGENGSGKSTALEVINFLFKRVLYKQYNVNQDLYSRKSTITADERRQVVAPANVSTTGGFRLEPNWDSETQPQVIRLEVRLDEIDAKNLTLLCDNAEKLKERVGYYAARPVSSLTTHEATYVLDITLNRIDRSFSIAFRGGGSDFGFEYLTEYHFYKELIAIHNFEHPSDPIEPLYESFTLISSYRNYHAFERSISLKDQHPAQQMQAIRSQEYSKSMNTSDGNEPSIFGLVRLRVAEIHFDLMPQKLTEQECEEKANKLPFIQAINSRLKVVNLECKIRLLDQRTWQYNFEFFDLRRGKAISDVNSLSAGQKAIVHLVFEAYGRGDLKGGVVIIDEPEIHLHYQFQHEYVHVIRELNTEQRCQYILVTHSEALINSSTINNVKRFSLDERGHTRMKAPTLSADQRTLIRILDNTRSTYAFFAKKVILVEGDSDRYLVKSIIQSRYPLSDQEIAILHMGGKLGYDEWNRLFSSFGLTVYCVADFDFVVNRSYPAQVGAKLKTPAAIDAFKVANPDWEAKIDAERAQRLYILKNGDLEFYLGITKGLSETIEFCNSHLPAFLADDANPSSVELRDIVSNIVA